MGLKTNNKEIFHLTPAKKLLLRKQLKKVYRNFCWCFFFPLLKVNLIPFNPGPDSSYNVSSPEKIDKFKKFILENGKIIATIRNPRGDDILAACGQLKSLNKKL